MIGKGQGRIACVYFTVKLRVADAIEQLRKLRAGAMASLDQGGAIDKRRWIETIDRPSEPLTTQKECGTIFIRDYRGERYELLSAIVNQDSLQLGPRQVMRILHTWQMIKQPSRPFDFFVRVAKATAN